MAVTASAPVATQIVLSPATTTLAEGASKQFSAIGKASDGSTVGVSPVFAATGGTVTSAGVYTAGQTPGSFRVIATDPVTSLADTAAVTVAVPTATLQSVILTPSTVSLTPGGTQQFAAAGKMSDGSTATIAVDFVATGGTISSSGLFTAGGGLGTYRVIARDPQTGLADSAQVTIAAQAPTLQSVVLTPSPVSLTPGAKQRFTAAGKMSDGSTNSITATFTATGGAITSAGDYTAGPTPGSYRVIATDQTSGKADTAAVTIASVVASVTVSPASASLAAGRTSQLTATVKDASGAALTGQSVTWASSNPGAATVSSTGLVSAVGVGSATITASTSGKQGQAMIDVTAPPSASAEGCPVSGYLRLVNVSAEAQLVAAINAAIPGDQIRLAPGTYTGRLTIPAARDGTASNPITLCGPRTATINNGGAYLESLADRWVFRGFRVIGGVSGLILTGVHFNVVDSLLVENMGNSGILVHQASTHNTVQGNTIRETGQSTTYYGEGIYVGTGATGTDPADSNLVQYNVLGPNIRAEHVQIVQGTTGNIVRGNVSDASGVQYIAGNVTAPMWSMGNGTVFEDNTITNISGSVPAMLTYLGSNNVYRGNHVSGSFSVGYSVTLGRGNVVKCDNTESGTGTLSNVTCTP